MVLRTRQHLAAVLPRDGRLVLLVLRYAHDLAPPKAVEAPAGPGKKVTPTAAERKMAEQLVESLAGPWKPEEYDDTYFDDVMALVKKKVASGKPTVVTHAKAPAAAKGGAKVLDLAALLEKSLAAKHESARAKRQSQVGVRCRRASRTAPRKGGDTGGRRRSAERVARKGPRKRFVGGMTKRKGPRKRFVGARSRKPDEAEGAAEALRRWDDEAEGAPEALRRWGDEAEGTAEALRRRAYEREGAVEARRRRGQERLPPTDEAEGLTEAPGSTAESRVVSILRN